VRGFLTLGSCVLALACSVQQTTDFAGDASSPDAHGSSGGFPGKENCENTVDDDNDGAIDCADDECPTYTCASPVPEGWTGPVALYLGSDAPPECPASGGYTDLAVDGGLLEVPSFACPTCNCDGTGITCTPSVQTFENLGCPGAPLLNQFGTGCMDFNSGTTQRAFKLFTNPPSGDCAASSDPPVIPPPTFATQARICRRPIGAKSGVGCFADSCIPKPEAPFQLCVYRNDPAPCPTGFDNVQTLTTTFQDQRACSACTCGTDCAGLAVGYDNCASTAVLAAANTNEQCSNLSEDQNSLSVTMLGSPVCTPAGGEPQGSVVEMQVTVCCVPQSP
jgi:hypothetical protein